MQAVLERVAVVEGDFVADGDIAGSDNPNTTVDNVGAAIGLTGVIDEARNVVGITTIEGVRIVEDVEVVAGRFAEGDAGLAGLFAASCFCDRDQFAGVFCDGLAAGDGMLGVDSVTVNVGISSSNRMGGEHSHGRVDGAIVGVSVNRGESGECTLGLSRRSKRGFRGLMNFAVIGAGAWGTAMAIHLSKMGHTVTLVPRRFEQALELSSKRENLEYLPGVKLPPSLQVGHELVPVLMETEVVLLACPAQALRVTAERVRDSLELATELKLILSLAKGLEQGTHLRPSEVISAVLPNLAAGSLTGPTNAGEVARGLPAAMVLAATGSIEIVKRVQAEISGSSLRVYRSADVAGIEMGGCLKNIYAIAAGICDGLKLGDNTKAAMLTRALAEMVRVAVALGAEPETCYGLSGFGDLVATCHGEWSRNRQFGERLGAGESIDDLMANRKTVVEGYKTAESFFGLCVDKKIDAPIMSEVYRTLFESKAPAQALRDLMLRELKRE